MIFKDLASMVHDQGEIIGKSRVTLHVSLDVHIYVMAYVNIISRQMLAEACRRFFFTADDSSEMTQFEIIGNLTIAVKIRKNFEFFKSLNYISKNCE